MEDLDISKLKLRGFNHLAIHKKIEDYLELLRSHELESELLAIGLLRDDKEVMNYLSTLFKNDFKDFKSYLDYTLRGQKNIDENIFSAAQLLCITRIEFTLERVRRGHNDFRYPGIK